MFAAKHGDSVWIVNGTRQRAVVVEADREGLTVELENGNLKEVAWSQAEEIPWQGRRGSQA